MDRPEGLQIVIAGSAVNVSPGVGTLLVNPSTLLAALAVTMPTTPADRDELCIVAGGTILAGVVVTAFSITGTSIIGSVPSGLTAGITQVYKYFQATGKWYRVI